MRNTLIYSGLAGLVASLLLAGSAHAGPAAQASSGDREIDARMEDLTQSLNDELKDAEYWEYGWGAFDSSTMVWSVIEATQQHDQKDRSTDIVQAGESLIGLADVVFRPLPAFYADSVCRDPVLTREDLLQCLSAREAMLERSAARAHEPYEWLPHLGNLGFNVLAGVLVREVADTRHALITAIPGEIIGEAQIWTTPGQPLEDFNQYKLKFGPLPLASDGAQIPATGLMVSLRF